MLLFGRMVHREIKPYLMERAFTAQTASTMVGVFVVVYGAAQFMILSTDVRAAAAARDRAQRRALVRELFDGARRDRMLAVVDAEEARAALEAGIPDAKTKED